MAVAATKNPRSQFDRLSPWRISSASSSRSRNAVSSSWWERERLEDTGNKIFSSPLHFHFHFWQPPSPCFLFSVSFPSSIAPLCLSFSSRLPTLSSIPHASRTCEIHRGGFPCDAVSPASSLEPRYYLDFHRPEMPSFSSPLFVVRPSSFLSTRRVSPRALPVSAFLFHEKRSSIRNSRWMRRFFLNCYCINERRAISFFKFQLISSCILES